MTMSDLEWAKFPAKWSFERPLCDNWASCQVTFYVIKQSGLQHWFLASCHIRKQHLCYILLAFPCLFWQMKLIFPCDMSRSIQISWIFASFDQLAVPVYCLLCLSSGDWRGEVLHVTSWSCCRDCVARYMHSPDSMNVCIPHMTRWPMSIKKSIPMHLNPLDPRGNYRATATSDNMKFVHLPLMGGLLHLVQREGDWAGPQPAQASPRCTEPERVVLLYDAVHNAVFFLCVCP